MAKQFLDQHGLATLWSLIKQKFSPIALSDDYSVPDESRLPMTGDTIEEAIGYLASSIEAATAGSVVSIGGQQGIIGLKGDNDQVGYINLTIDGTSKVISAELVGTFEDGAEVNVIDSFKVNGSALTVTDKAVNLTITQGTTEGTINVNGEDIPVTGIVTTETLFETLSEIAYDISNIQDDVTSIQGDITTINNKLDGVEAGAQVNVIEGVSVNGTAVTPDANKVVNITIPAAAEYTITKRANAETGYAATYDLKKDGTAVGDAINIPKDFLVKSAELKVVTTADDPYEGAKVGDKYIDFVVNTYDPSQAGSDVHIYLPVNDLVDTYTGDETTIHIGNDNVISAKVDVAHGLVSYDTYTTAINAINNTLNSYGGRLDTLESAGYITELPDSDISAYDGGIGDSYFTVDMVDGELTAGSLYIASITDVDITNTCQ